MKHLEDKRVCPSCGHAYHERDYLMARKAEELVLNPVVVAWIVALVAAALVIVNA